MGRYKTQQEWKFVLDHITHDHLKILDMGGGNGRFAQPLADRGHDLTIVDKSKLALENFKAQKNNRIKYICDDFMKCAVEDSSFDLVIAIESVCYFDEMEELFKKINQALVPGGLLIFTELNKNSWRYLFHKMFRKEDGSYNVKSVEDYKLTLYKTGFEINDIEGFVWIPLTVASDSILVDLFAFIESRFELQKWIDQSPWLLVAAQKKL